MVKRIFVVLLSVFVLCSSTAYADVRVYVNGNRINQKVIMQDDTTFVPIRAVSESLGARVLWDEASNSAFITFTEDDAIAKIVSDVSQSVVTIVGNYNDENLSVQYNNPTMHGTGVIYKSNGYIVTNAHVVKDIKNLTVVFNDGTIMPGNVLYSDDIADLAIVKVDKIGLTPISMADKNSIISGKTAIAIGTPISLSMRNTVTKGIICGVDVSVDSSHYKLIQTDATINPGNSGGPLLNIKGELIGINSSKYAGLSVDNVGFAIPVDTVEYAIKQFEIYGRILRPTLKFSMEQSWEAKIGIPTLKGITVKNSTDDVMQNGDIITKVNDVVVHSITDWNEAVKHTYNGKDLKITYTRNGVTYENTIK